MQCTEKSCGGEVDMGPAAAISLRTGCQSSSAAFPCKKRGRLYSSDGGDFWNRRDETPIFLKNGKFVHRRAGQFVDEEGRPFKDATPQGRAN